VNILALYPGMSPGMDDFWPVWTTLAERGHTVAILAAPSSSLKGISAADGTGYLEAEQAGVRIAHIGADESVWTHSRWLRWRAEIAELASGSQVIVSSHHTTFACAARIAVGRPIVSILESWGDDFYMAGRRRAVALAPVAAVQATLMRNRIRDTAAAVLDCDPVSRGPNWSHFHLERLRWPVGPALSPPRPLTERANLAVHVGALTSFKNSGQLPRMASALCEAGVEEFHLVGPEVDVSVVAAMRRAIGGRLRYARAMSREDALCLLSEARVAVSPCKWGGWGFLLSSWLMETPILALHQNMALNHMEDSVVASRNNLAEATETILRRGVAERVVAGGRVRVARHGVGRVASELESAISEVYSRR